MQISVIGTLLEIAIAILRAKGLLLTAGPREHCHEPTSFFFWTSPWSEKPNAGLPSQMGLPFRFRWTSRFEWAPMNLLVIMTLV